MRTEAEEIAAAIDRSVLRRLAALATPAVPGPMSWPLQVGIDARGRLTARRVDPEEVYIAHGEHGPLAPLGLALLKVMHGW